MKRDSMAEQAEQQSVDYLLTAVRSAVGPIPVVGPLISELAGVVVPNQRIDRISKFVVELEQRVRNLEFRHEIVNQLKDEHFTDLLEEGIRQAARSLTDDRRRYIAWSSPNFPVKSPYGSPGSVKLLVPPTCFWGGTRFEVPRFS